MLRTELLATFSHFRLGPIFLENFPGWRVPHKRSCILLCSVTDQPAVSRQKDEDDDGGASERDGESENYRRGRFRRSKRDVASTCKR